jgi:hypothetical protein
VELRARLTISLHCQLSDETCLIDAEALGLMKPTAFVINAARGDRRRAALAVARAIAGSPARRSTCSSAARSTPTCRARERGPGPPPRLGRSRRARRGAARQRANPSRSEPLTPVNPEVLAADD